MATSEDRAPSGVLSAGEASLFDGRSGRISLGDTKWQDTWPVFLFHFQILHKIREAFNRMLVRPLRTWVRLNRDVSELAGMDYRDLRDLGINRTDVAAIRAGAYKRASIDDLERIVFCPEAGKQVTRTLTGQNSRSLSKIIAQRPSAEHATAG